MATILVHLTHGPEHPTRAALGFLVAKAALEEGHTVTMFLAGDAVQLLRDAVLDNLAGLGTGKLRDSYDAVAAAGAKIYLSGISANGRGLSKADIEGKGAEFAMPNVLVNLALEADRMFTY
jgi:uncharacterized protein